MTDEIPWSHPVVVADLRKESTEFRLSPDEATRAALADFADVIAVPQLSAIFQVRPTPDGGALVEGTVEATVTQECVVSLEPFDNKVFEEVSLLFVPEGSVVAGAEPADHEIEIDPPEQLTNGALDLGVIAAEFLALGIDPYPRKPGAVFQAPEVGAQPSAFAALEQLKRGKDEEKG